MSEEQQEGESWSFKVSLQGTEVNLRPALPLRVRDWKELKRVHDITLGTLSSDLGVEKMATLVGHVLDKAKSPVSVDDLYLEELSHVFRVIVRAESIERAERPT